MEMSSLADILEHELEEAFEVKDKRSLHRYISVLTENLIRHDQNQKEHQEFREAIIRIDTRLEEGFKTMNERFISVEKRFESVDKRFESVDKRFDMMFRFISLGFVTLAAMMSLYQFLG